MSRRMISMLVATAAVFAVAAPSASAAEAAPLPYCWGAVYGDTEAHVCFAENTTFGNGTVDPGASTDCIIRVPAVATTFAVGGPVMVSPCKLAGQVITNVGVTGFEPGRGPYSPPYLWGLSVRYDGQYVGTLYVDDAPTAVRLQAACVGACGADPVSAALLLLTQLADASTDA